MSKHRRKNLTRIVVIVVVAGRRGRRRRVLRASAAARTTRRSRASSPAAVGVYPGTPVEILGVNVGEVTSVKPTAATVEVDDGVRQQVQAADQRGRRRSSRTRWSATATCSCARPTRHGRGTGRRRDDRRRSRTGGPAELDDIYSALNRLSVALGPGANKGANKNGALSTLLKVSAGEPQGQRRGAGQQHHQAVAGGRDAVQRPRRPVRHGAQPAASSPGAAQTATRRCGTSTSSSPRSPATWPASAPTSAPRCTTWAARSTRSTRFVQDNAGKLHTDLGGLSDDHQHPGQGEGGAGRDAGGRAGRAGQHRARSTSPTSARSRTRSNLASLTDPASCARCSTAGCSTRGRCSASLTGTIGTTAPALLKQPAPVASKLPDLLGPARPAGPVTGGTGRPRRPAGGSPATSDGGPLGRHHDRGCRDAASRSPRLVAARRAALVLSGCGFTRPLQRPAARRRRPRRPPVHGDRLLRQRPRPGAAVGGQGQRRRGRPGRDGRR